MSTLLNSRRMVLPIVGCVNILGRVRTPTISLFPGCRKRKDVAGPTQRCAALAAHIIKPKHLVQKH